MEPRNDRPSFLSCVVGRSAVPFVDWTEKQRVLRVGASAIGRLTALRLLRGGLVGGDAPRSYEKQLAVSKGQTKRQVAVVNVKPMGKSTARVTRVGNSFAVSIQRNSITARDVLANIEEVISQAEVALSLLEETDGKTPAAPPKARPNPRGDRMSFDAFMDALEGALSRSVQRVRVTAGSSFVKLESVRNGHRVYISKGKLAVGRVDSTLPPESIPGAKSPGFRNGKIASWLPPEPDAVAKAIELLASDSLIPLL